MEERSHSFYVSNRKSTRSNTQSNPQPQGDKIFFQSPTNGLQPPTKHPTTENKCFDAISFSEAANLGIDTTIEVQQEFKPKRPSIFLWLSENGQNLSNGLAYKFTFSNALNNSKEESGSELPDQNSASRVNHIAPNNNIDRCLERKATKVEVSRKEEYARGPCAGSLEIPCLKVKAPDLFHLTFLWNYLTKILKNESIGASDCNLSPNECRLLQAFLLRKYPHASKKL